MALIVGAPGSEASARCYGSENRVVERLEVEIGRDPAAAVDLIAEEIARTDPARTTLLAELYLVQSIALHMSGKPRGEAIERTRNAASGLAPGHPINLMLGLDEVYEIEDDAERLRSLAPLERDYRSLQSGTPAKTCRAVDLAFYHARLDNPRKAFAYAKQAYRNSAGEDESPYRAEAISMLAYFISTGHDYDYAQKLHSDALRIQTDLGMSDLAAQELAQRGYTELANDKPEQAVKDFAASAEQARSYGNAYAVDYALLGLCEAALEADDIGRAAPACEHAYTNLNRPSELMAYPSTALMADLLVRQDKPREALGLLNPLIASGRGDEDPATWIRTLKARAAAHSALGRNAQAYADARRAMEEIEAYLREERASGLNALRARFQTEELEGRLADEERASKVRLRLAIVVIAGSVLVLALLGTLVFILLSHRRRFRRLAMIDPLTGLGNRRATLEKADEALREVGVARPRASVALFDIDHFKSCNDRFGHDAGDDILSEFARIVEACVRPGDIVGRWGGEEFLAIFPATDAQEAAGIIERIRVRAARERFDFAPDYRLEFSAGIAMLDEAGDDMGDCIKLADERLYAAKALGRNRTCLVKGEGEGDAPARSGVEP
ncbi:GGDEF domain-containing protein [Alteriqipengyuania sp. 357]